MSRRTAMAVAAAALLVAALAGWKGWLLRTQAHTLHEDPDDYAALSLGHAINLDFWAETFPVRQVGYFQFTHPGLPLQGASWLVYRAARPEGADAAGRALAAVADPSRFWLAERIAVAVLFVLSVLAALALAWGEAGPLAFAVPLALLAFAPGWPYWLEQLGNESFALPIFLALWLAVRRALSAPPSPGPWLVVGAVGGVAYLNKLNYVAWLVAAGVACVHQALRSPDAPSRSWRAPAALAAGAALSVAVVGGAFLGTAGLWTMLEAHLGYLLHTGVFGSGETGVVKPDTAWANLVAFLSADGVYTAWLAGAIALVAWARPWRAGEGESPARAAARGSMLLFLGAAAGLSFLAAMKHYFPRYLVPMVVPLAFALLELRRRLKGPAVAALLAATLAADARAGYAVRDRVLAAERTLRETGPELEAVRALPVHPGQVRLWLYKAPCPEYSASFVLDNAGHRELLIRFYPQHFPEDMAFFKRFPDFIPWEYMILERDTSGPTPEPATRGAGSDVVFEGRHLVALRRRGP
jgi:hypothetical protein